MAESKLTPWSDCKVAFGAEDEDALWAWYDAGSPGAPDGWSLCETDCSGARLVAVFRVEGLPTEADGEQVLAIVAELDRTALQLQGGSEQ